MRIVDNLFRIFSDNANDTNQWGRQQLVSLSLWSNEVEAEIRGEPSSIGNKDDITEEVSSHVEHVSVRLLSAFLCILLGKKIDLSILEAYCLNLDKKCRNVLDKIKDGSLLEPVPDDHNEMNESLFEILRACQNWLRWYLQMYEPLLTTAAEISLLQNRNHIQVWKTREMMEIYLQLIRKLSHYRPDLGRFACQLLFYSSYNPFSGIDENLQNTYQYLADDCSLIPELFKTLLQANQTALQLSLARIVHNILVSFPKLKANIVEASVDAESLLYPAKWVPADSTTIRMKEVFWDLVMFQLHDSDEVLFPGEKESKRAELVVEVLRVLYALKAGPELNADATRKIRVIFDLLRLDSVNEQCYDCQLAAICLLMETNDIFSESILSEKTERTLKYILETQVSMLLESKQIGDSDAASVIPILVVVNKFCKYNSAFRKSVMEYIFPPETEVNFQSLAHAELERHHGKAKNMSPLDAPKGTMRWKMIQLMTWPHNITKRLASEVLWTLCNDDAEQFVFRTGLGNALPFLGIKGFVQLPIS